MLLKGYVEVLLGTLKVDDETHLEACILCFLCWIASEFQANGSRKLTSLDATLDLKRNEEEESCAGLLAFGAAR